MGKIGSSNCHSTVIIDQKTESKRATFDDLLKFGRYTVYITTLFTFSLLAQSLQLLFMSFGGAEPNLSNITCTNVQSNLLTAHLTAKEACQLAKDAVTLYNGSCSLNFAYKYGSVFKDFDVECNPEVIRVSTSIQNVGLIIGTLISGYFANTYGRIKTYATTLILLTVSIIASSFANSVLYFTIIRFFVMLFTAGSHNVSHIFVIENLPPNLRSIIPSFISYALGFMMASVIANFSNDWNTLTYVSAGVTLIPLFLLMYEPFAVETPSYIFSQANAAKYKTGEKSTIAKLGQQSRLGKNKISSADEGIQSDKQTKLRREAKYAALRVETFAGAKKSSDFDMKWRNAAVQQRICEIATERVAEELASKKTSSTSLLSRFPLAQNRRILCFTILLSYSIFTLSTTNYGILLGIDSLPGAIWINIILSSTISYTISWICILVEVFVGKIHHPLWAGRLQMHITCSAVSVAVLTAIFCLDFSGSVKPENPVLEWIMRSLAWLVLGTANQLYIIHHVQSSETFPTPIRAIGCTIVQTANRFGTAAGPLLLLTRKYGSSVPYLTMTVMFMLELFLYINYSYGCCVRKTKENAIIRETKGLPKPEYMPSEAEAFARHLKIIQLENSEINSFT